MRFLLLTLLIFFSCQTSFAKSQGYISRFIAAERAYLALGQLTSTALSFAFGGPNLGNNRKPDYAMIMVTPKFRQEKLSARNEKTQTEIDELNKKIKDAQSKGKNIEKLAENFHDYKYQIFSDPSWNSDGELISFILVPLDGGIANPILDFRITDTSKLGTICNPISKQTIDFNARDKTYLDDVYDVDMHDKTWTGYKTTFDPKCIIQDTASAYVISFGSEKYSFDLNFYFSKKEKDIIKDDFGILE
jgi:hypothetical protein